MHAVLKETQIIIWDEAPMQHYYCPEAIDHTLKYLFKEDEDIKDVPLFGSITVLFVSDFRQTLPVVPKCSRGQIINASLPKSRLWRHIKVLHLIQNESDQFTQWLSKVGAGSDLTPEKSIKLPPNMHVPHNDVQTLIDTIYPGIDQGNMSDQFPG